MTLVRYCRLFPEIAGVGGGAFDTRPATPTFTDLRVLEEEIKLNYNYELDRDIQSRIHPTVRLDHGQIVEGPIRLFGRPDEVTELLLTHFGKVTTSGLSDGFSHTYTYQDDPTKTMPSVGLDLGLETLREKRVSGVAADVVTINIPQANEIEWEFGLVGADITGAAMAANSPTYSTLDPYYGADITVTKIDGNDVTWDNLTLTLTRGIKKDAWRVGSRKLQDIELGPVEINITGDLKFVSAQLLNDFLSEATHTFDLTIRSALISGTDFYDITIDMNNLTQVEDPGPHINRQERMLENLNLMGLFSSTTTFSMVVNNNESTPATYTGA